ncbi:alpha/beta hydrolase family protein [Nonlabens marinus]|uniref:Esterase/lipase/thioesterase family protein n=1 Tax=Nonlabens marinus S1-08 TaxID=1454201 RepID=W8VWB4_9FLAO|nr:alpha/beta hydrolase [Nonlabens marinus]BAO54612.1 esterase/lipase/thioesterase family protein [Nonlabens marinus S1-08]
MMNTKNNLQIPSENGKSILLDYTYEPQETPLPVIIFCHGLKGFKDWGVWDLMGAAFAKANYLFIKFNFSHNGGTPQQPIDFPDLEAFGNNNYSLELRDLARVLDWLETSDLPVNQKDINLIGHSRAGGITTITAANDKRINKLITLAGVADYEERFPTGKELEQWKTQGVYHVKNGRTHQEMPFFYQMYEDFLENKAALDILEAAAQLSIPHLIVHGTADPTVDVGDAHRLKSASKYGQLSLIRNADHVFGASHPWQSALMPADLRLAVQCMMNFLNNK